MWRKDDMIMCSPCLFSSAFNLREHGKSGQGGENGTLYKLIEEEVDKSRSSRVRFVVEPLEGWE